MYKFIVEFGLATDGQPKRIIGLTDLTLSLKDALTNYQVDELKVFIKDGKV